MRSRVKFTNVFNTHELRYGFDTEFNNYDADLNETWYRFFGDARGGFASYIQERALRGRRHGHARSTWRSSRRMPGG